MCIAHNSAQALLFSAQALLCNLNLGVLRGRQVLHGGDLICEGVIKPAKAAPKASSTPASADAAAAPAVEAAQAAAAPAPAGSEPKAEAEAAAPESSAPADAAEVLAIS